MLAIGFLVAHSRGLSPALLACFLCPTFQLYMLYTLFASYSFGLGEPVADASCGVGERAGEVGVGQG